MDSSNKLPTSSETNFLSAPSKFSQFSNSCNRQQPWSFPDSLIYYITKNPSTPKCYENMIQSCKHFFIKNRILIVPDCVFKCDNNNDEIMISLKNVKSKIWMTTFLTICSSKLFCFPSAVIPRIFRSDINELKLRNQKIYINDLKLLTSKCIKINFDKIFVINDKDSILPLEMIFGHFSKVEKFYLYLGDNASEIITSKTVPELLKLPQFFNRTGFCLDNVPETFDINSFYKHIKKNTVTKIHLVFSDHLSEGYKAHLQTVVDEILATENREFMVPYIRFPGITWASSRKLYNLYYGD